MISNQQSCVTVHGGTGRWHRIEASTNLLTWLPATAFYQTNPVTTWPDTASTNLPYRFYRARDLTMALDTYVARSDTNYGYALSNTIVGPGAQTTYVFDLRSQAWLTTNEVNRTLWRHWLILVKPHTLTNRHALLVISGGSNPGSLPTGADARLRQIATNTRTVVAELKMVPNQPLMFTGETNKSEDALIAYAWDKFLRTGNDRWPPRLPMTKAAVRAMDTITAFCATPMGGGLTVDRFVVTGASKRGWTTWTTAIIDRRVVAIVPLVIDLLNLEPSFAHHYRAYGFWSPAIQDYVDMGIPNWFGTPQFRALMELVEPYEYRERLALPKLLINATGDEFFLPDSARFYFDDLPGVKYLRYVPNTGHSLSGTDYADTLEGFYQSVLFNGPLPHFSWTLENSNSVRVVATDLPTEARLWQATNPSARDFRHPVIGQAWTSTVLPHQGNGVFVGTVTVPPQGWKAFFVELTYVRGSGLLPLKLTTQVYVVPDTLPYQYPP